LAEVADAAEAEVVDIIRQSARGVVLLNDVAEDGPDVLDGNGADIGGLLVGRTAETLIEVMAADLGKVVSLRSEDGVDEFPSVLDGSQVAVAKALVYLNI